MLEFIKKISTRFVRKVTSELKFKSIVFDSKIRLPDTIFLSSMGRSGSTILSDIINYDNDCHVLFEPFRYDVVEEAKEFIYPFYLEPNNKEKCFFTPSEKIILGRVHTKWIDQENGTMFPKRRLIKDIRTNLYLKWINNNFPEMKMILLLRHPGAVIASWLTADFGDGKKSRERLLSNSSFLTLLDDKILSEYSKAESTFEILVFFWCIYYWVPFQQFKKGQIHTIFYENIISNPDNELKKMFSFLEYQYSKEKVLKILKKPSSTTKKKSFQKGEVDINAWKNKFSIKEINRIYEIMNLFNMDKLYDFETSMPNMDVAASLFESNIA